MKIATFNINGIKARLPRLLEWLKDFQPDVACLQEIKSIDENFPRMEIESLGYHVETHGQKGFNGVALISKHPIEDIRRGLPNMQEGPLKDGEPTPEQARYIEATIKGLRIASIYLPNGNPYPGPKFDYKVKWMANLINHAKSLLTSEQPIALLGDYNIIPEDEDCYDPASWVNDALTQPESRSAYQHILNLGYTDAIRQKHPKGQQFSYWDYQKGAWQKDNGIRIDHLLLSPQAADLLEDSGIDKTPRGKETPSDHTPAWAVLSL